MLSHSDGCLQPWKKTTDTSNLWLRIYLSTGSGRHSDAAHEIRLIGCCILLNVVPKTVPLSGSSWSPLDRLSSFGRLASLEAMRLFFLFLTRFKQISLIGKFDTVILYCYVNFFICPLPKWKYGQKCNPIFKNKKYPIAKRCIHFFLPRFINM